MSGVLEWLDHLEFLEKYGPEEPVNIFYLDHDPAAAARAHCDTHVVKMIVETAQILSTVWHLHQPQAVTVEWNLDPDYHLKLAALDRDEQGVWCAHLGRQRIYKKTHPGHPCCVWAGESKENYDWLWQLGMELCDEYTYRYKKRHATLGVLRTLEGAPPKLADTPQTQPPPVMPEEFTVSKEEYYDTVASYRRLYVEGKQRLLKWTKREPPSWLYRLNERWALRPAGESE